MTALKRNNSEDYRRIFENAIEGIFQFTMDGKLLKVNPAMARIYKYDSPADMINAIGNISKQLYVNIEDRKDYIKTLLNNGHVEGFETQNYCKDKSIIWVRTNSRIEYDEAGKPQFIEGFLTEITSHKEAEIALQESEERYRALVERLPGAVFLDAHRDSGTTFYISPKVEDILGYSTEEWISQVPWPKCVHPDDRKRIQSEIKRTDKTGEPFHEEYRVLNKNNEYVWVREEASLVEDETGKPLYWQGFLTDISSQKYAEIAKEQSEEQFKKIFQANPIASCIATLDEGRYIAANDAYWKLSGFKPEEFLGRTSRELGFLDENKRNEFIERLTRDKTIHNEDGRLLTKSREIRNTLEFFDLIVFNNQNCILGMFYDITDKVNAQRALQDSEERFRLAFLTSPDAININRLEDGLYVDINDGFTRVTGYTAEDVIGKTSHEIDIWHEKFDRALLVEGISKEGFVNNLEAKFRMKNGQVVTGLMSARVITLDSEPHIISITREIDTIKQAQETLQRQLKELSTLNFVASVSARATNMDELIEEVTQIIGESLFPDNFGFLLLNETGDALLPHPSYRGITNSNFPSTIPLDQGIAGQVAKSGEALRIANVRNHKKYIEVTSQIRSELCVPVKQGKRILGVINTESTKINAFTEDDERLLTTISSTLVTAIEKLFLLTSEIKQRENAEILRDATITLASSFNIQELLGTILETLAKIIHFDSASIAMQQNNELVIVAGIGFPKGYRAIGQNLKLKGKWSELSRQKRSLIISDAQSDDEFEKWEGSEYIRGWIGVAMTAHKKVIGYIFLDSKNPNAFTSQDATLAETFASSAAVAIENARLYQNAKDAADRRTILYQISQDVVQTLTLEETYTAIYQATRKLMPCDAFVISLHNQENNKIIASYLVENEKRYPPQITQDNQGLCAEVISTGKAIIYNNNESLNNKNVLHFGSKKRAQSILAVPMKIGEKTIGMLSAQSYIPNSYKEEEQEILEMLASHAAAAIENARLFEIEQQNRERAEAMREATAALTTTIEIQTLYKIILDSASKLIPFDSASIEILEQGFLEIVAVRELKNNKICVGERYPYEIEKWGKIQSFHEPIIIANVQIDHRFEKLTGTEYIRGWMGVPMIIQERLIGFLNFDSSTENFFTSEHASLAQTFGNQAAIAIENSRLFLEESRRSQIIKAMVDITNEFATAQEIIPALEKITKHSLELLHASTVAIYLLQDDNKTIKAATVSGAYRDQLFAHTLQLGAGITGNIIETGKPEIVDQMFTDSRRITVPGTPKDDAQRDTLMSAPLIIRGMPIGAINVWRQRSSGLFKDSELNFLVSIANQTSILIESIRLFQETARRAQEAHAIAEVGRDISSTLQLDNVLERIAQYAKELLRAETSAVYLLSKKDSILRAIAAIGEEAKEIKNDPLPLGSGILGNIALRKSGEIVNKALDDSRAIAVKGTEISPKEHLMGVPVFSKDHLTGLLAVWRMGEGDEFKPLELDFLSSLAQQAAVAIENARLFEAEQKSREKAEAMREATASLTKSIDVETLYENILNSLALLISFDSASIEIVKGDYLEIVAYQNIPNKRSVIGRKQKYNPEVWENPEERRWPLIIPDVQKDDRFVKVEGETKYIHGWMAVPLIAQGKLIGFLNLDSKSINHFTEEAAALAQNFGNQAAISIENAHLFEKEHFQRQRNAILLDLMHVASSSLSLNDVMQTILDRTCELVRAESGTIQLLEGVNLSVAATTGFAANALSIGEILPLKDFPLNKKCINNKIPIYIPDTRENSGYIILDQMENVRSFLLAPLVLKNKVIGLITLENKEKDNFTDQDTELVFGVAQHAAIAIENARLFETEQRRHRESETLRQAALAITTSLDLENVLETILIVIKQVVPYDSSSVILLEGDELRITAAQGLFNIDHVVDFRFPADDALFHAVRNSEEPVIIKDAQLDSRFKKWIGTESVRGWMGVPLILRNEVIGFITFDSYQEDVYNESLATLTQAFANQAASAIKNARQFETEQRHFQEAETLRQAAESITSTLDIQQVLDAILEKLNSVVPFNSARVFLIENDQVRLTAKSGNNIENNVIDQLFPANNPPLKEISDTKLPLILENAQEDSRFEGWAMQNVHGWMGVPLITHGTIIGYITLEREKIGTFTNHDSTLAMTFAHQAATAIENARLFERGEQQIRRLTVLRDIDSAISSSFDLRVTLNLLVGHALRELNADAGTILLYNVNLHSLSVYINSGFAEYRNLFSSPIRVGEGFGGRVALQRKLIQIPDLSKEPIEPNEYATIQQNFKSYFGVPLLGKGRIKGVLEVYTRNEIHPDSDWINFLHTLAGQAAIAIESVQLFKNLQRSNQELILAYDTTLAGWGRALELRDKETQGHTNRVVELTVELAKRVGVAGEDLTHIMRGTLLHDIGKVGIPDSILNKPEPLTEEEWELMRQHPKYAYDLMNPIPFLQPALDIPYGHHERWDGSGYPHGLKGEDIPLAARIFAVVDIWDALLYERPYREAWPEDKVLEYIKNAAGIELDPNIVEKFLDLLEEEKHFVKRVE